MSAPMTWSTAVDRFVAHMRDRGRRYSTIKGHRCQLVTLAAVTPDGPASVTADELDRWLEGRGASRRHALAVARVFYSWAVQCGFLERSPVPAPDAASRVIEASREETFPPAWRAALMAHTDRLVAAGRAVGTVRLHQHWLRLFAREHPDPWVVTGEDLNRWLAAHPQWKPETRKSVRSVLRRFYIDTPRPDGLTVVPTDALASVRIPRALPRPTSQDAFEQAVRRASDRDRLMILLAAYAGLRCREIAAVRPSTDVQAGFLYVTGKGGDQRRIPLHPVLVDELAEERGRRRAGGSGTGYRWLGQLSAAGYLFPSQDGGHVTPWTVSDRLSAALPDRWTAHTLRHRFASNAYASTRDLRAVQELLGHASPATTARYVLTPDSALLAAVMGIA